MFFFPFMYFHRHAAHQEQSCETEVWSIINACSFPVSYEKVYKSHYWQMAAIIIFIILIWAQEPCSSALSKFVQKISEVEMLRNNIEKMLMKQLLFSCFSKEVDDYKNKYWSSCNQNDFEDYAVQIWQYISYSPSHRLYCIPTYLVHLHVH